MNKLLHYIKSTFNYGIDIDAKQFSPAHKLNLLAENKYYVYISPITFPFLKYKQEEYTELVKKAINIWMEVLNKKIIFEITDNLSCADIKIYWVKSTRKCVGLQFTERYSYFEKLCISIGIMDIDYGLFDSDYIYHIILHEFGHILCLGHSPDSNDIMFCGGTITNISENDKFVLNLIYSIGSGKSYLECKKYIEQKIAKRYKKDSFNNKNLLSDLSEIALRKKDFLILQDLNFSAKILRKREVF